jgi:hypothetical protein
MFELGRLHPIEIEGPVDAIEQGAAGSEHDRVGEQQQLGEEARGMELRGQGRAADADVSVGVGSQGGKLIHGQAQALSRGLRRPSPRSRIAELPTSPAAGGGFA